MLDDDEISTTGDWVNQKPQAGTSVVGSTTLLKTESGGKVKVEGAARPPVKEGKDGQWCAVCHDGGDTLYCCDNCPKVYHMFCYIPPLTTEPPDDWVCLMCATASQIKSVMSDQLLSSPYSFCV